MSALLQAARWTALATLANVMGPTISEAALLRVPSQYPTIQAGVDAAVAGDSVLVAPGTYTDIVRRSVAGLVRDACVFLKTGVTVASEAGSEVTIIDMQQTPGLLFAHVLFGFALGLPATVIDGFTILGAPYGRSAVLVYGGGKVVFRGCILRDHDAGPSNVGGMDVSDTDLDLIDCVIEQCRGTGAGGVYFSTADLFASGCTFVDCEGTGMQVFGESPNDYRAVIEDCRFIRNHDASGNGGALAVRQYDGGVEVRRCVFEDNECRNEGGGATIGVLGAGAVVEDCVFWNNRSLQSWAGGLYMGKGEVRRCSFSGNSGLFYGSAVLFQGGPSQFFNNVLSHSSGGAALGATSGVVLTGGCNVFWNNSGDAQNYPFAPTDRVVDPQFCNEATGDLTVMQTSPCLPENSLGCGLIGAREAGCGVVSVDAQSWGRVKGAYR